jgi:hypothetical protein
MPGRGGFDAMTQYTVNTQLVNNTLMNIADSPTNVQLPGSYDDQPIQRVPIIVTVTQRLQHPVRTSGAGWPHGEVLLVPRSQRSHWHRQRHFCAPTTWGRGPLEQLVDTFPQQAIDFYGALRARIYDEQVRALIHDVGLERVSQRVVNGTTPRPHSKTRLYLAAFVGGGPANGR